MPQTKVVGTLLLNVASWKWNPIIHLIKRLIQSQSRRNIVEERSSDDNMQSFTTFFNDCQFLHTNSVVVMESTLSTWTWGWCWKKANAKWQWFAPRVLLLLEYFCYILLGAVETIVVPLQQSFLPPVSRFQQWRLHWITRVKSRQISLEAMDEGGRPAVTCPIRIVMIC